MGRPHCNVCLYFCIIWWELQKSRSQIGKLIYPELPKADLILPHLIFGLLPIGIKGLMITALLAAMGSTISAVLNSASTLFTYDFMKKFNPEISNQQLVISGKISALVMIILGSLWGSYIAQFASIVKYFQGILSYMYPPIIAIFLAGVFWKKANGNSAFSTLASGLMMAICLILYKSEIAFLKDLHFLLMAPIIFAVSGSTLVLITILQSTNLTNIHALMWSKADFQAEKAELAKLPWYHNYHLLSYLLILFTLIFVYLWR